MRATKHGPIADLDLLIEAGPNTTPFFPGGLIADLKDGLGRRVDVVEEQGLHRLLRDRIQAEASLSEPDSGQKRADMNIFAPGSAHLIVSTAFSDQLFHMIRKFGPPQSERWRALPIFRF